MPLPEPQSNENHDDFIKRCMSSEIMLEEYPDRQQRYAVCESLWDSSGKQILELLQKLKNLKSILRK